MIREVPELDHKSYKVLIESVRGCAIYLMDIDGYIISWNKGAEQIKGYNAEEITGKHTSIFYTYEDLKIGRSYKDLQKAKEKGRYENEGWRVRKDGSLFWA